MKRLKKGFTVAEMMIVLLVLSIVLAAAMPIITKRSKSSTSDSTRLWSASSNASDIYWGIGDTQGVILGATDFPTGKYAKLMLNTNNTALSATTTSHMLFSNGGTETGKLYVSPNGIHFGKDFSVSGDNTVAIGHGVTAKGTAVSLGGSSKAGDNSVVIGYKAEAYGDTTGNADVVVGEEATAIDNGVAIGYKASAENGSIAIGKDVETQENSVAIGLGAKSNKDNGIAIGYQAGADEGAIAIGKDADSTISSGNSKYSIAIGYGSKAKHSYSTAIGPKVSTNASNQLNLGTYYGDDGIQTVNIGNASGTSNLLGATVAVGSSATFTDNSIALGAGTTANANQLNMGTAISGDTRITTINIGSASSIINILGATYTPSDKRRKNIIGEYKGGLNDIMKIKTYEFTYKDDKNKKKRVGVIAQELQKIFPNAVKEDDDNGYLEIRKEDMFYAMINAVKELYNNYLSLKEENKQLKRQIEELSKRIDKLEQAK